MAAWPCSVSRAGLPFPIARGGGSRRKISLISLRISSKPFGRGSIPGSEVEAGELARRGRGGRRYARRQLEDLEDGRALPR